MVLTTARDCKVLALFSLFLSIYLENAISCHLFSLPSLPLFQSFTFFSPHAVFFFSFPSLFHSLSWPLLSRWFVTKSASRQQTSMPTLNIRGNPLSATIFFPWVRNKKIPSSETKKRVSLEGKKLSLTKGNFFSLKFPSVRPKRRKVEEIPPSETMQRRYQIPHHRSLLLST